jgi:uncharacterized protein YcnI
MVTLGVAVLLLSQCAPAWGHSDLDPRRSLPNIWETYTLKVPTEPQTPTVRVRLQVPQAFEIEMIEHRQAWQLVTVRDERGYIREITWSGSQIPPQTFEEFKLLARNAKDPGLYVWKIDQAYENGEVVTWEAQTQILPLDSAGTQRAEAAWRSAQVATTVSLVALGISITLIVVTILGIVRRGRRFTAGEP